jgi:serine/threonine-protein kinase RsbW
MTAPPPGPSLCLTVAREYRSAGEARRVVGALLPRGTDLYDRGLLLVTEVVANAVEHTASHRVRMTAAVDARRSELFCAVFDEDPTAVPSQPATARPGGPDPLGLSESGRGLHLVDELSQDWGCVAGARGKWVWFRLASEAPESPPPRRALAAAV